ncbi:YfbU family protein [Cellulosimicrobium funkei]|uniref:Ribbon-helix-helix protein CopG domain-containing protein n=1 Tax=Cellulosimicrobium funkei TaxID=264251 RepID=A0A4Y8QYZ2_9MICO|nr:YfbU family protein [Cellulosimicrobium funkei]TFF04458.1 hypothetical protein E1O70_18655 [Cellulosimicrobium funkei]TGA67877.1 hypothetical protein EQW79_018135 [Cellulosimicrobium terreum]
MPKTTLGVRLEEQDLHDITALANAQGISVSELARRTLVGLVNPETARPVDRAAPPQTMTTIERQSLALQHDALAELAELRDEDDESEWHRRRAKALRRGYTDEYADEFRDIEPEFTPRDSKVVMDILTMFDELRRSVERGGPELQEQFAGKVAFPGFDFNDVREGRYARYARHLIEDDRWTDLAVYFGPEHERGNSHMPMLSTYLDMLAVFLPLWADKLERGRRDRDAYLFTADEIESVLEA